MDILQIIINGMLTDNNQGLSTSIFSLDKIINGIQKGRYYLIGADSGVGKTTFTDYVFVINLFEKIKENKNLIIFYCSYEISKEDKIAKWLSYLVYKKYNLLLDSNYIMGRKVKKISKEEFEMIKECHEELQQYLKQIIISDESVNPTSIFKWLINDYYEKNGVINYELNVKTNKKIVKSYTKKNEKEHIILIIDHLSLVDSEMSLSTKQTMDKISRICVKLKNIFRTTIVIIQQFNTEYMHSKRINFKGGIADDISPQKIDFGDSKNSFNDADVVIGLIRPYNFKIKEVAGINIKNLEDTFVSLYIIKNRYGQNAMIPMFFNYIANEVIGISNKDKLEEFYSLIKLKEKIKKISVE